MINNTDNNILIVDDDPTFLAIIAQFLEAGGYHISIAKNGEEAIVLFEKIHHALVLSDLYMPGMSGLQLLAYFKDKYPETPIIVISGASDFNDAIAALRLGAWDYILKPFTQPMLEQTVRRVFEKLNLLEENKKISSELALKNVQLSQGLEQLQTDQKAGENVQLQLLPKQFAEFSNCTFSFKILPSLYLSGDFVEYFQISPEEVGFYIADVSGHGASSAFVTVLLKSFTDQLLAKYITNEDKTILHPEEVLKHLSDQMLHARLGKYMTMIYCVLNMRLNILYYSIGGHYPSPIIWDGLTTTFLPGKGYAVGIYDKAQFSCLAYDLPSEFTILMLSDGIFEIMNGNTLADNENTLLAIANTPNQSIEKLLTKLSIHDERGFPDDITLFLIHKNNPNEHALL